LRHRGKVRDVFDIPRERLPAGTPPGDYLLMVATDRLSAFDVVLPDPIPGKGEMLCQISNFWFAKTAHLMPNHLTGIDVASVLPEGVDPAPYAKRSVVTRKLKPVPVEAIARGYLIGSGWKDYQRTGKVSGIDLPDGLRQAEKLPSRSSPRPPRRRSATTTRTSTSMRWCGWSAPSWPSACATPPCASTVRRRLRGAARHPAGRYQVRVRHRRRWPAVHHGRDADARFLALLAGRRIRVGTSPPSYDKQFVRDYLETLDWGKTAPGPSCRPRSSNAPAPSTPRRCTSWPASRSTDPHRAGTARGTGPERTPCRARAWEDA
jgi:phosphoribosylaminoimidazole-succinocarboxamide synthase